ncbi:hypothetical protein [Solilutibacter silvestris]|uniref:Uncharacterized protein n=1 Tax=Solilutibacter silvestris TaxID=1645665 RepID=A0A2K1Q363_9GAMM|nr:hypothetical protein [Lysobacter silvestris]PNS09478.1 hypothetical protein Lysil_1107 [Lysobacter silvestris]
MKVQLDGQQLRLRIDEDELARLLTGDAVAAQTRFGDRFIVHATLQVDDRVAPMLDGDIEDWRFILPESDVRALAARLPTRDGLGWTLPSADGAALELRFDVDVRDSARRLRDRKHSERGS